MVSDVCREHWDYDDFGQLCCDRPEGHDGPHYDAGLGFTWSKDEPAPADTIRNAPRPAEAGRGA